MWLDKVNATQSLSHFCCARILCCKFSNKNKALHLSSLWRGHLILMWSKESPDPLPLFLSTHSWWMFFSLWGTAPFIGCSLLLFFPRSFSPNVQLLWRVTWVPCAESNPPQQRVVRQVHKQICQPTDCRTAQRFSCPSHVNWSKYIYCFLSSKLLSPQGSANGMETGQSASEQEKNLDLYSFFFFTSPLCHSDLDYSASCLSQQHKTTPDRGGYL